MRTRKSRSMKDYASCVVKALKIKHLLLQCRELRNARSAFFRTISETNDDFLSYSVEDKMKYLLQPQDNIYALSHAIYKMYAERQSQLLYLY